MNKCNHTIGRKIGEIDFKNKNINMNLNKLKEKLIKEDKEFKEEYYKEDLAFGIARLVSNARAYKKIDQTKLAKLIKTKQSGISRLERGNSLPSLTLVQKIAKSLDFRMKISFISNKTGSVLDSDGIISTNDHIKISDEKITNMVVMRHIPLEPPEFIKEMRARESKTGFFRKWKWWNNVK